MKEVRSFLLVPAFALAALGFSASAAVNFPEVFAPSENYVKPAEEPCRQSVCLNGDWQFQPVPLPDSFREGEEPAPGIPPADAGKWEKTPIRIPSPWNANSFAGQDGLGGDFRTFPSYPKEWEKIKMGWLRRTFKVPAAWTGRRVVLHFQAVAGKAEVFVNGKKAGGNFEIFLPFDLDVTDAVKFGADNELLVSVLKPSLLDEKGKYGRRTYQAGSFWGQHAAGIWQDVFLVAVPVVRAADVFVQPMVDADTLQAEVTLRNDTGRETEVSVGAQAFPWISKAGKDVLTAPLPSSELGPKAALAIAPASVKIPAHGESRVTLKATVQGRLKPWSQKNPDLYGLVVQTSQGGKAIDSKYTRFGWRQLTFKGSGLLLNGKPLVLHGDSWHFLGIPQMTRRYAWAWFTALHDAGLNAVRLHAQPYPSFYLDVADEMGILVLDESAVWASDGGPRLDDPRYWKSSERDLEALVKRDRNHPSVFGWSVSNEVHPIVVNVLRNPPGMLDELIRHYGIWADICRKTDPTRPWISADGENDGEGRLPTYVVHYGGAGGMQDAGKSGKPWGVGEDGNAYYGTPEQVAETNGERAYESFLGRMEGVAISSYASLVLQRENHAVYRSVFNLVWYGLKPLPLGLKDLTKPPTLADGVFFTHFEEGQPGVQPERLGPYCTTLNPGYDPSLPLYETWPLFEAIRDAATEPLVTSKWSASPAPATEPKLPAPRPVTSAKVLAGDGGKLAVQLGNIGVPLDKLGAARGLPQLLFVDGANPPPASARKMLSQVLAAGGTVVVWGADSSTLPALNALLPAPLEAAGRQASSLLPAGSDPLTAGMKPSSLYFSEQRPSTFTEQGLGGPLIAQSKVLLKANDTDWEKWNKQPEYAKTAMVVRSEQEAKPAGVVLAEKKIGKGRLLVTTLPAAPRLIKGEKAVRMFLTNLGLPLGSGMDSGKPLLKNGTVVRMLVNGYFPAPGVEEAGPVNPVAPSSGEAIRAGARVDGREWKAAYEETGGFHIGELKLPGFQDNVEAWLSFWVYSPRGLDDLLLEPNLPRVNFETTQNDGIQVWLNGSMVIDKLRIGPPQEGLSVARELKLHLGWNHFLIKLVRAAGGWDFNAKFTSNQPEFLSTLDSALEKP